MDVDVFTIALLLGAEGPPTLTSAEEEVLQDAHMAHLADLHDAGHRGPWRRRGRAARRPARRRRCRRPVRERGLSACGSGGDRRGGLRRGPATRRRQ